MAMEEEEEEEEEGSNKLLLTVKGGPNHLLSRLDGTEDGGS
jgi:hypothetical protein